MKINNLGSNYERAYFLDGINKDSIIYCFGVGEDITFERELIAKTDCKIFAFDPTPRAYTYIRENPCKNFTFIPFGISDTSEEKTFYLPENPAWVSMSLSNDAYSGFDTIKASVKTLQDSLKFAGHTHIEYLKLSIEGEEFNIVRNWVETDYSPPAEQMWIRIHPNRNRLFMEDAISLFRHVKGFEIVFTNREGGLDGLLLKRKEKP